MVINPWHLTTWRSLQERCQLLPSSILLVGKPGTDLPNLGMELAGMILCDTKDYDSPCTACTSCHLFAKGVHPDLHVISTETFEENSSPKFRSHSLRYTSLDYAKRDRRTTLRSVITVDQIRVATDALDKSAGVGSNKVCLIYPTEALNLNSANALLKSLEEPTKGSYFLLLSSFPGNLPPTIRSRCSRIDLNNPTNNESTEWLTTVHNVDLSVAQQLIAHGFGPYEVLQMNTKKNLNAHQTLVDGLGDLILGNLSAGDFTRRCSAWDLRLTLKVIQSEILRGLRESIELDEYTDIPALITPDLALEFREALFSVYSAIGRFLNWPSKAVDEQLFLESIAQKLSLTEKQGLYN